MLRYGRALGLSLTLVLCASALYAAEAESVKVKPGHPKVMLTKEDIARTARNIKADNVYWRSVKAQVDDGSAPNAVYGLVYQATGDAATGKAGVESLMSDRTARSISSGYYEDACLGYDWLFPLLSPDQRQTLFDRVKAGMAKDLAANMNSPWTNFVQRATMRIAIAGCAFASDFPEAQQWVDLAWSQWTDFHLPAVKLIERGGGWPEGALYGYIVFSSLTRTADAFATATDKDPYSQTSWFADRITWWRFHTWPQPKDFGRRAFYMYDPYGDSERWRSPMQNQEIAAELLVMRHLDAVAADANAAKLMQSIMAPPDAPETLDTTSPDFVAYPGKAWRWYMRQLGSPIVSPGEWSALAYYDESAPDTNLTTSKALSWYARGTGQIFIRSSWLPDATWIAYQCGPRFTYHQHLDQGQFNIFKRGDLTGESGVYEPSGPSDQEGHLQGYTSRAIAHNTINVYDPAEVFSGYRSGNSPRNDGGERTWRPYSNTGTSAAYWQEGFDKGAYDTGRIVDFQDKGQMVYIASDLTGAYNSDKYVSEPNKSKVHEVTRQLVYLRPQVEGGLECLVVFDRVRATDPSFEKRVLVHFPNDVRVSGKETAVAEGDYAYDGAFAESDTGGGRLFVRSVYPKGATIHKVGGPGHEYWVFGKNFPVPNTPWERGYGKWRLEIMPPAGSADDCFLTVYFPADKSANAAPAVTRVAGKDTLGVRIGDDPKMKFEALFSTTGEMGAAVLFGTDFVSGFQHFDPVEQGGKFVDWSAVTPDGVVDGSMSAPVVTDTKVSDVTTEAKVEWKTEKPTTGYVEFGDTPEMKYLIEPAGAPSTTHEAMLRGLASNAKFYVRAAARDADGNVGFSRMYELATPPDTTPPAISDLKVVLARPTDVTISWSTDDRATATVTAVSASGAKVTADTTAVAPDQRVTIDGLAADTDYTVTVAAKNDEGLTAVSAPLAVRTAKVMPGYFETGFDSADLSAWQPVDPSYWSVEKDSITGSNALLLTNADRKRTTTVYTGADYGDFTLRVKARTLEGEGNGFRDYAIIFGCQDPANYYAAWMCGAVDESLPGIVRVKDGQWQVIGSRPNLVTLPDREWHAIEVVRKGTHMEAFFDGTLVFEADDATFGRGRIGFGSNNDSAEFDDLKVIPQAELAPVPPTVRTKKLTVEGLVKE